MKIKVTSLKRKSKKISDFRRREWKLVHKKHFGTEQDENLWKYRKLILKAEAGKEIIGVIQGDWIAGVMYIDQLIVKNNLHGKGVGKELMEKAEKLAFKNKVHKIYLKTGVGWKAVKFYEKLGYKKEGKINNFYEGKDFWIMSKNLR